ncbi:ParA family protein [Xylocopilactobacillus apis]|uniref:Sporulation initiation inhibitor protein Soj n=1 Tax=Xylocopilactobacillus apis TaxID=2932183 RepID=A0AAU9CX92_9LACO|nr:AAA family ATPase [Xylocopilactobacillus apis]BDR57006.1 sporulation initiation inhibitor Soj [Xylocopilactobacillus apis]
MGKIIAIANQKGGVGKTTTTSNLGASLGTLGKRTLLVDFDPQGNLTTGFLGSAKTIIKQDITDALTQQVPIRNTIIKTKFANVSLLPAASNRLASVETQYANTNGREMLLKQILDEVKNDFDFIFIDCPPSLGLLSIEAFTAADTVLITLQSEFYALEGLSQLLNTIDQVRRRSNPQIGIEGVLITMYDARTLLGAQVIGDVRNYFYNKVYDTIIPRNIGLAEAPSHQMPIYYYDPHSKGAIAYVELAKEVLASNGN